VNKYDKEFSEAMRLKLRLNREARSKGSAASPPPSAPSAESVSAPTSVPNFRDEAIRATMARHPGLTYEEVQADMKAMGF